jgi:membrane protease subunit HflK
LRVRIDEVRRLAIGATRAGDKPGSAGRGEYLTGDQNLALVGAVVQYRVSEPAAYLAASADRDGLLADLAETALAEGCARYSIDDLLRNRRQEFSNDVREALVREVHDLGLGVDVLSVSVVEARPPEEVAAEFADAQSAHSDRDRRITEGETEAGLIARAAQARAAAVEDQARTQASRTRTAARGRADRFTALLDQAAIDPDLTRRRLYLDALERGLKRLGRRIVLEPGQAIDLSVLGVR